MQTDPVGYDDGINWYLYCRNNPLGYIDPSGLWGFSPRFLGTERYQSWQDVRAYAEEQRDLAVAGDINDIEALARISDEVAEWSEKEYIGIDLETFMFVNGLAELLCRQVIGWTGPEDNPNQIRGFGDSGFHPDYQEGGGNQVDHCVSY